MVCFVQERVCFCIEKGVVCVHSILGILLSSICIDISTQPHTPPPHTHTPTPHSHPSSQMPLLLDHTQLQGKTHYHYWVHTTSIDGSLSQHMLTIQVLGGCGTGTSVGRHTTCFLACSGWFGCVYPTGTICGEADYGGPSRVPCDTL